MSALIQGRPSVSLRLSGQGEPFLLGGGVLLVLCDLFSPFLGKFRLSSAAISSSFSGCSSNRRDGVIGAAFALDFVNQRNAAAKVGAEFVRRARPPLPPPARPVAAANFQPWSSIFGERLALPMRIGDEQPCR